MRKYALFDYLIVKFDTVTGLFWCERPKFYTVTGWNLRKKYGRNTIPHTAWDRYT
jgi:hypothetical protein